MLKNPLKLRGTKARSKGMETIALRSFSNLTPAQRCLCLNVFSFVIFSDLLSPKHLLTCLYPGDDGKESPNPTNEYQLSKLG